MIERADVKKDHHYVIQVYTDLFKEGTLTFRPQLDESTNAHRSVEGGNYGSISYRLCPAKYYVGQPSFNESSESFLDTVDISLRTLIFAFDINRRSMLKGAKEACIIWTLTWFRRTLVADVL